MGYLAYIIPIEGGRPDQGLPGGGGYPDNSLPRPPGRPAHPIVIPPDAVEPGVPTHPIYLPVYPDNSLPGYSPVDPGFGQGRPPVDPGYGHPTFPHPSHPIVFPPGLHLPNNDLPATPGLPPLEPSNPIVLPPGLPPAAALVIPIPQTGVPKAGVPEGSTRVIIWYGPGSLPQVAYIPPAGTPK